MLRYYGCKVMRNIELGTSQGSEILQRQELSVTVQSVHHPIHHLANHRAI